MSNVNPSKVKERYPGMRALATKMFQDTSRSEHGELSRKLKYYLETAKSKGIATELNWASENLESLRRKFGSGPFSDPQSPGTVANAHSNMSHNKNQNQNKHAQVKLNQKNTNTHRINGGASESGQSDPAHSGAKQNGSVKRTNTDFTDTNSLSSPKRRTGNGHVSNGAASERKVSNKPASKISQRQARFQTDPINPATASPYVDTQIRGVIVGTNEQLEKPYFRLTGQVNPAVVRPPHILEKSLEFVLGKYKEDDGNNYQYVTSQLQSIRQDLTVQHVETSLTVETYEHNIRIALDHDDIGEFNKCLTRLMDLYERHPSLTGNQNEFKAYSIYYTLLLRKWGELSFVLQKIDSTALDLGKPALLGPAIDPKKHGKFPTAEEGRRLMLERALICVHCVARENMINIWQNTKMVWPLENKLLGKIIERAQARGLEGLLVSTFQQNQSLPIKHVAVWLGLLNDKNRNELKEVTQLLEKWGVPIDEESRSLVVEKALPCVQRVVAQVDGKFDIKGQI